MAAYSTIFVVCWTAPLGLIPFFLAGALAAFSWSHLSQSSVVNDVFNLAALVGAGLFGYLQWFYIVPEVLTRWRNRQRAVSPTNR